MIEYANLYLAAVSALSSLIQAGSAIKANRVNSLLASKAKKARGRAETPYKKGGKNISAVIDDALLNALSSNIQRKLDHLATILVDDAASWADKAEFIEAAEKEVCSSLTKIRDLNQGELPTKRLKNLWDSHGCNRLRECQSSR